jgi:hypothetical protein
LREIAGDVVERPHAAPDGARDENVDRRIIHELRNERVGQALAEPAPPRQIAVAVAVDDRDRALRAADDAAVR